VTTNFAQTFEAAAIPVLTLGWSRSVSGAASNWVTVSNSAGPPSKVVFAAASALPGIADLSSPSIFVPTGTAQLKFTHSFDAEADPGDLTKGYDGGLLEIKVGSGSFVDILDAGGAFVTNGYTRTIDPTDDNPLGGRRVWSGNSKGVITTLVNLPAAAAGQTIQLRWRFATDSGNYYGSSGWSIESVLIAETLYACGDSLAGPLTASLASPGTGGQIPVSVGIRSLTGLVYTLEYKNTLSDPQWLPLSPALPGTGGDLRFQDTNATAGSRFYHVRCSAP
jgi:hypothetical protein